jgi:hygromycin-B 7''-O-kinase
MPTQLPAHLDPTAFDALHDDVPRWRPLVEPLAALHAAPGEKLLPLAEGTVMVVLIGQRAVFKLYPPFLRDHADFERAALRIFRHGSTARLPIPTPELLACGEHQGWPWLLMTQLMGEVLTPHWSSLAEPDRCALLHQIGQLMAAAHGLPQGDVAAIAALAPMGGDWTAYLARQRALCRARQERTGLPPHLLDRLEAFIEGAVPEPAMADRVILTGEYTPMNLLVQTHDHARLAGMFDFGDGLVGARESDWLGPLVFLCAGHAARVDALLQGYGAPAGRAWRLALLRLLLLHRYSCLKAQIALPGWERARSFEDLALRLWPD